jgi:hypothetical protein
MGCTYQKEITKREYGCDATSFWGLYGSAISGLGLCPAACKHGSASADAAGAQEACHCKGTACDVHVDWGDHFHAYVGIGIGTQCAVAGSGI